MEKIKIITDSTSDLPKSVIDKYDIEVIPLYVNFGEETYTDGVDINLHELLERMDNSDTFPTTAQVNPQRFMEYYKKYLDEGYKIVSLHISSKMSGTYQSACIARDMLESDSIYVIDSQKVTATFGAIVIKAAKLKEEGLSAEEIYNEILRIIPHVKCAFAFETLDNLVKGGRLSKTAGVIGSILGIKPIVGIVDGEMAVIDKVRGSKKAIRYILDYIDKNGIKKDETAILLHVENKDILDILRENLKEKEVEFIECEVGCVVGVHAGRGACGVVFIQNN
ncbi:DegV family protein [Clostridium sp. MSJ-11]|uniref:DegV family protein n=1 Tax=Clostridium mobile TaxID=2841512 RepID=A0ABS6ELH2_9CLOT|nr:DegV family protein [Clostridium mobile]MBU5486048.1 DegV family protein [Clostridium mobile]